MSTSTGPGGKTANVADLPTDRAVVLRNLTCAYCGRPFDAELNPTKEHVIGRRFVPRGFLDGQWNLILNACKQCNNDKSGLEDDISVITMMPDPTGTYAVDDERLRAEVARKAAKSRSRRTGKIVADSHEEFAIKGRLGPATLTFNFIGSAQVDEKRLFRLAHYQFQGFFYWITYDESARKGGFTPGVFYPLLAVRREDWGASRMRWFMDLTRDWDERVHAVAADGFYKLMIRKSPDALVWCWATEWNHTHRIAGLAGEEAAIQALIADLPAQPMKIARQNETERIRMRSEVSLPEEADDLFTVSTIADDAEQTPESDSPRDDASA